jgi:hypothetical protein
VSSLVSDSCAFCYKFIVLKCVIRFSVIFLTSVGTSVNYLRHAHVISVILMHSGVLS